MVVFVCVSVCLLVPNVSDRFWQLFPYVVPIDAPIVVPIVVVGVWFHCCGSTTHTHALLCSHCVPRSKTLIPSHTLVQSVHIDVRLFVKCFLLLVVSTFDFGGASGAHTSRVRWSPFWVFFLFWGCF